ncbi:MAG: lamin tail domain-containing protein [Archangium sp.]|nr:lamin tail domain-containing protein [Archangium sp.]
MFRTHAAVVVMFAAFTFSGLGCTPEPMGTPCATASDCGAAPGPCVENTCVNKVCGTANVASGTATGVATAGDCKATQCDGTGSAVVVNDDTDVPSDAQDCTDDLCTAGVPSHPPRAAESACGTAGLLKCDGLGSCVTCIAAADCGASSECQTRTCVAGTCGVNNVAAGTALAMQTAGDCKVNQCDGNGAPAVANDDADVLVDVTSCTNDVCTAGVPSNPPVTARTACTENNGALCDGAGACVTCVSFTDCPGSDTECQQRTCTAGVCGFGYAAQNTPVASQTANDCKKNVCDGAGAITPANDDTDLPNDNNSCTTDSCAAGAPTFTNVTAGTACGTAGVCSGGQCVGCNAPSDCPGSDTECTARTCVANVCGVTFTAANTAVAAQAANDCKKNVCDGSGNVVNQNDNTDLPLDDGNQCTSQVCTAGVASFPTVPVNTVCTQNGGAFCSAGGNCVACTAASQCPGSDTECQTRTCTNNVCGVTFAANTVVTASQTAGDCQQNRCNGAGGIVSVALNSDLPADDGNLCTAQTCNAGVPSFPPTAINTACGPGGGSFCNGSGTCVSCNAPSQCAGTDTECQVRTCTANTCGVNNTAAGTTTASQTTNDCKRNQCDGAGNVVSTNDDGDLPADDGNQCTNQVCTAGVPSFPPAAANTACNQNGGSYCSSASTCVGCNAPAQCPGTDTECSVRSCAGNSCGFSFTAAGTPVTTQTAGDCKQNECDGAGGIVAVNANSDVPADDGNQCTAQACSAGVPSFPSQPVNTACNQNGGAYCNGSGACSECNAPAQCAGSDTECQTRTCNGGSCGFSNTSAGTPVSSQTAGDCKTNECDGAGSIVSVTSSADVPPDDGNQCTDDVCSGSVPSHPARANGTACNQGGGTMCSAGQCVECNSPSECPGQDTECQARTCNGNSCGSNFTAAGTAVSSQNAGDCKVNQCDGVGNVAAANDNTDAPIDGNQCTFDVCNAGVPSNPPAAAGTACSQNGGSVCDGAGACISPPQVASTTPADGSTPTAGPTIVVTFSTAMNAATLTGQTAAGACSGSIQVSQDNFASCIAFSSAAPTMSGGNTVATLTAAPGLLVNRSYRIRVTTAAQGASGTALAAQFTQPTGFTTTSPNTCSGSVVISQFNGGGGLTGATYKNDFVELHNRGTTAVSLAAMSLQYASTAGTTWTKLNLTGSIQPGGYYLIQLFSGGAVGASLPTPDLTAATDIAGANGKLALVNSNTVTLSGACPLGPTVLDFVGYGTANCFEGVAAVPALTSSTAAVRAQSGCADVNNNGADFATATPSARNSASAAVACACTAQNESNAALEADYCTIQFPLTLSVAAGAATPLVFGQLFEVGVTEAAGGNPNVRAQLGWGLPTSNPQYEAGWTWTNATFNVQSGNNDEYQASFIAPSAGSYRYVYRFSLNQGVSWTYCDQNSGDGGAGSNAGLSFEFGFMGSLTVP